MRGQDISNLEKVSGLNVATICYVFNCYSFGDIYFSWTKTPQVFSKCYLVFYRRSVLWIFLLFFVGYWNQPIISPPFLLSSFTPLSCYTLGTSAILYITVQEHFTSQVCRLVRQPNRNFWSNLAREYPQCFFLQIMHPRTFHIKNPSDATLASLSMLRKWPVSMATIVKIKNTKSYISQYIFKLFSQY